MRVGLNILHRVVLFCAKHSLSPSVKAGGYGTAGWAIGGDIIIDMSKLTDMDIEPPKEDGSFTTLRDIASVHSKGKKPQEPTPNPGKRRREDDANLRHYDSASQTVASFLRDSPISLPGSRYDGPSPSVRRRVDRPQASSSLASGAISQNSSGSSTLSDSVSGSSLVRTPSTLPTTPSTTPPSDVPPQIDHSTSTASNSGPPDANPFGYLEATSNFSPAPTPTALQSTYNPAPSMASWVPQNLTFADMADDLRQIPIPVQAEPINAHAYVAFGAGMRQKEIDTFTAQHKLEARYLTGSGDGIPYHVPL